MREYLPRPKEVIDILEEGLPHAEVFGGSVWRVVSDGRDPSMGYSAGGRWDDGTFDVLYTSLEKHGAAAEACFHAMKGQPVAPSKPRKLIYQLQVEIDGIADLSSAASLHALGVDIKTFGQLSYHKKSAEYPSLQQIGEVAHFVGYNGLLVPNARWNCQNLVVFTRRARPGQVNVVGNATELNLQDWFTKHGSASPRVQLL